MRPLSGSVPRYSTCSMSEDAFYMSRLMSKKTIISEFAGSTQLRCGVRINLHDEKSYSVVF